MLYQVRLNVAGLTIGKVSKVSIERQSLQGFVSYSVKSGCCVIHLVVLDIRILVTNGTRLSYNIDK